MRRRTVALRHQDREAIPDQEQAYDLRAVRRPEFLIPDEIRMRHTYAPGSARRSPTEVPSSMVQKAQPLTAFWPVINRAACEGES